MKILIAEDDFTSRNVLQLLLKKYGEVDTAVDGKEALEAFETGLGTESPYELVCLDIMMPGLDGLDVAKHIRNLEKKHGIKPQHEAKVIMVTALSDAKTVFGAFMASQATGYLVKPYSRDALEKALKDVGVAHEQ